MVLTEAERKERRQAGMDAKSKAEKIGQTFSSGRPPLQDFRTPNEAVKAASVLLTGIRGTMSDPKFALDPNDCAVHIAYVDTGFTGVYTRPFTPGQETELSKYLADQPVILLGLLFSVRDREKGEGNGEVVGVRPFIVTPRTTQWLNDLRERAEIGH